MAPSVPKGMAGRELRSARHMAEGRIHKLSVFGGVWLQQRPGDGAVAMGPLRPPGWVGKDDGPLLGPAREHGLLGDKAVGAAGRPLMRQVHLTLVQPALLEVVVRHRGVMLLPAVGKRDRCEAPQLARLPPDPATCQDQPSPSPTDQRVPQAWSQGRPRQT